MGLTSKVAGMMMLGGASRHAGRKPPGKAEGAQKKAAEAQALRAEAEAKVAKEQDAVLRPGAARGRGAAAGGHQ